MLLVEGRLGDEFQALHSAFDIQSVYAEAAPRLNNVVVERVAAGRLFVAWVNILPGVFIWSAGLLYRGVGHGEVDPRVCVSIEKHLQHVSK